MPLVHMEYVEHMPLVHVEYVEHMQHMQHARQYIVT